MLLERFLEKIELEAMEKEFSQEITQNLQPMQHKFLGEEFFSVDNMKRNGVSLLYILMVS